MSNAIKGYEQKLKEDMEGAIGCVIIFPDGSKRLQNDLLAAVQNDATDMAGLAHQISMAHAALAVVTSGSDPQYETWYQDIAQRLLRRATEALSVIEANSEPRMTARLN